MNIQNIITIIVTVIILSLFTIGCQPVEVKDTNIEQSEQLAKEYVQNLDEYKNYNPQSLRLVDTEQADCQDCYIFVYEFDVNSANLPEDVTSIEVKVPVSQGEVDTPMITQLTDIPIVGGDSDEHGCIGSAGYAWCEAKQKCIRPWEEECADQANNSQSEMTYEQAIELAQNTECTEKGRLTDNYILNEITNTWWIDLEMKPEFENKICNPACVIFEDTGKAEINWRCTGGLPPPEKKTFEDCIAEGNPVMESYPRQCRFPNGETVTEII